MPNKLPAELTTRHSRSREALGFADIMALLKFHTRIHAIHTDDLCIPTRSQPYGIDFETLLKRFAALPRMFIEPDGSFVWTGSTEGMTWQLDGQTSDCDGHVICVELQGRCPPIVLDNLLEQLDWPRQRLGFEDVPSGQLLSEIQFREGAIVDL